MLRPLDPLLVQVTMLVPAGLREALIVFGTAPLALAGWRDGVRDLDLFTDEATCEALAARGFAVDTSWPEAPVVRLAGGIEVYRTWIGVSLDEVRREAREQPGSRGLRVASLRHVLAYKQAAGRPKDADDIALLERVLTPSG